MKLAIGAAFLAAGLLANAATAADAPRPAGQTLAQTLAQSGDRCGVKPMRPMDCLHGSWVCSCQASGQICDWELIGCMPPPGTQRPTDRRPEFEPANPWPRQPGMRDYR